ncbi:Endoglucanase gh5-1 [Madurella mycetomatis]|uniref:cellulase n=1 Tax=Madurella mycetomatis TaxID=100816 RepID=A0A175VWZ4_9PEZI|nr:Endoglucanase gh5-1 [Madurella mycetomatis]
MKSSVLAGALATNAMAQNGPWQQCGGVNFQGSTSYVSGYSYIYPGAATPTTMVTSATQSVPTSTTSSSPRTGSGKFRWFGSNQSGAEFGKGIFPGRWGTEFIFPDNGAIQTLVSQGYNTFRVAFSMERLHLTDSVNYITNTGAWAVLDPHNFGRYYDNVITDTAAFRTFWTKVGRHFAANARVIFDTNNEYHTMDQTLVLNLNQAAIDGVRDAGATSQYIWVEGNQRQPQDTDRSGGQAHLPDAPIS